MPEHLQQTQELEGKTAVVTGSSRGIGRTIAEELAAAGADVAVNYHSSEAEAYETAEFVESLGVDVVVERADVSDFEQVQAMADSVHEELGSVDILVNNAGINIDRKFEDLTPDQWRTVIDINLTGSYNTSEVFFEELKAARDGRIVNVSSVIGEMGNIGQANYAASKSGLFGLTRSLAKELATHETTVNAIAPGFTRTDMLEGVPEKVQETILEGIPVDRFADPEEISGLVRYLASERSSYITGQVIDINGGMHI